MGEEIRIYLDILLDKEVILLLVAFIWSVFWITAKPSNDRDWIKGHGVLSYSKIKGNNVKIFNIRDFKYRSLVDFDENYINTEFNLNKIKKVHYVVVPFGKRINLAHTFLSFEFEDDKFMSISIEIRRKVGDEKVLFKTLVKRYEIIYIIGTEDDLVRLRSDFRKDSVYIYPTNTSKEDAKLLFLDMLNRANKLSKTPEFYNMITNNCTTNIVKHINKIKAWCIPFSIEMILPGNSDKIAYNLGFIDGKFSFNETQNKFLVNKRAKKSASDLNFSRMIRG